MVATGMTWFFGPGYFAEKTGDRMGRKQRDQPESVLWDWIWGTI